MRTPQRRGGASGDHQPPAVATPSSLARPGPPSPRNFGEEGGLLTSGGHLRLPDLPALQVPQASPPAHDELLFITGRDPGTGGSTGAPYLRARVPVRYYPLLWELRDFL